METSSLPPSADDFVPAWPCSRRGLPGRMHCCIRRWSLTPPFHPDPALADEGGLFLWPFSGRLAPHGGSPPRVLSDAVLYGVRTFLDPARADRDRPASLKTDVSYRLSGGKSTRSGGPGGSDG